MYLDLLADNLKTQLSNSSSCTQRFKSYFETNNIDQRNAILDKMALSICDISDTQLFDLVEILHQFLGIYS